MHGVWESLCYKAMRRIGKNMLRDGRLGELCKALVVLLCIALARAMCTKEGSLLREPREIGERR